DSHRHPQDNSSVSSRSAWLLLIACAVAALIGVLRTVQHEGQVVTAPLTTTPDSDNAVDTSAAPRSSWHSSRIRSAAKAEPTAAEVVAGKLALFGQSRRSLAHALAERHHGQVSDNVERFFDAVESGDWDRIEAAFKVINGGGSSAGYADGRLPEAQAVWPAIIDAYGAAEQVHEWPAQKLLDYGN